jgi:putative hydrolase of HD superfamily
MSIDFAAAGERLRKQLAFIDEVDRLKTVLRRNVITDKSRRESSAEHSWHLGMMVLCLAEHAAEPVDLGRALAMALVHDVVEIDAGDTFVHSSYDERDKAERERVAAERIFGLLPEDQSRELGALWREFELGQSAESKLVRAVDRLQPVLLHRATEGAVWREHAVRRSQVERRVAEIEHSAPALHAVVRRILEHAVASGQLVDD